MRPDPGTAARELGDGLGSARLLSGQCAAPQFSARGNCQSGVSANDSESNLFSSPTPAGVRGIGRLIVLGRVRTVMLSAVDIFAFCGAPVSGQLGKPLSGRDVAGPSLRRYR